MALCAAAVSELDLDLTGNSSLERSSAAWQIYQRSLDLFGGDEILVIALRGASQLDEAVLEQVRELSDHLESLDGVRRVDSIATVSAITLSEDGNLDLSPALPGAPAPRGELAAHVRRRLARDRVAPRSLVSGDERTFAINVILEPDYADFGALVDRVRDEVAARERAANDSGMRGAVSGVPVFRVEINRHTQREIALLAPFTAATLAGLLVWLLRSPLAAFFCLLPGGCAFVAVLAAMAIRGLPVTVFTLILPPVLMALGCAYSMHLVCVEEEQRDARWRELEAPVLLSGFTTAIGFAALSLVRLDSIRWLGQLGALGVGVTLLACVTLVPAIAVMAPRAGLARPRASRALARTALGLAERVVAHRRLLLWAWLAAALLSGLGLWQLRLDTDLTTWLRPSHPARLEYDEIKRSLSGISPVNVVIDPKGADVLDDDALRAIDGLGSYLQAQPEVGKAISIGDPLRQIHGSFEADPAQPLPSGRPLLEQYLLLLETVPQLGDLVTPDRETANVLLRVDDNRSHTLTRLDDKARAWWREHAGIEAEIHATGIMFEYARAEDEIVAGQLRGLAFAFAVIALVLWGTLRSPRLALLSLLPNIAPLVLLYGALGLAGVSLEVGTALVGSLALGIAVDDTVHLCHAYQRARSGGSDGVEALRRAYAEVLRPVLYSTVVLAVGFGVFCVSAFALTRNLGIFTASILILCLLADLSLLGALLAPRLPLRRSNT